MIVPVSPGYESWPPRTWADFVPHVEGRIYPWGNETTTDITGETIYIATEWWTTEAGLYGYLARDPYLGCWGGYVAVAPGHTLHGRGIIPEPVQHHEGPGMPRLNDIPAGIHSCAHGGIKYAGPIPGTDIDDVGLWWLGFRCDDATDYTPAFDYHNHQKSDYFDACWPDPDFRYDTGHRRVYRTIEYARDQVERLAVGVARSGGGRPSPPKP